jgi:PPOX class probable F420-dependent enzyme
MASIDFSTDFGKRVLGRLQDEQVAWLTTVSAKGEPQPSPVWFLWENDSVLVYSQPNTPKLRAIQANPNVTLNFNSDEHGGNVIVLKGTAERVANSPAAPDVPAYVEKYSGGFASLNMTPEDFAAAYSEPIRITLTSVRGH